MSARTRADGWRERLTRGTAAAAIGLLLLFPAPPASALSATGLPVGPYSTVRAGDRPGGTELEFPISDQATVFVDVGTGNLRLQTASLQLPGVNSSVAISQAYNSFSSQNGSTGTLAAHRSLVTQALS